MKLHEKSLEQLLVSKVRLKALRYFMLNPTRSIHLRGAVREFEEEINAVRRELMRLEEIKLIASEDKGNRKYFKLNKSHPFVDELSGLIHKTYGLGGDIVQNEKKLGAIQFAVLTPAYTKGFYYGSQIVDLVIVGSVDMSMLETIIKSHENINGKEIHYTVLTNSEFSVRKRRKDQFYTDLIEQDIVMLIGEYEEFVR